MSGLRVALRIARRDALQHRGRSLLVMTMIALPVLAGAAGDVLVRSGEQAPAQQVQSQLAGADAWIVAPSGVRYLTQSWQFGAQVPITIGEVQTGAGDGDDEPPDPIALPARPVSQVLPLLPAGSTITPWRHVELVPVQEKDGRYISASADLLDISSPAAGDRYRVLRGTAPARPGQIAVTGHLAARLGVGVGDTVTAGAPQQAFTVTAIVRAQATGGALIPLDEFDAVVALPGALHYVSSRWIGDAGLRYLVTSPHPITLDMVDALNAHGVAAYSRAVAADPAIRDQLEPPSPAPLLVAGLVIGLVMAIMQVIFLAGPAFAIGARRMRRQLGQLAAAGARPTHLRWVVLGTGLVLGAAGALVGLLVGIGLGALLRAPFRAWLGYRSFGLQVPVLEVAGIAGLGVVTAVLAALIPAITVGRTSALSLLARQPARARPTRWWSLAGSVLAVAGLAVTVWMATRALPEDATGPDLRSRGIGLAGGVMVLEIGLLMAVPLIVQVAARLGARLPTAGRLALRDASRHHGRTTPAIAAVTVCATAAVLLAVLLSSAGQNMRSRYVAGIPTGDVQVQYSVLGMSTPVRTTSGDVAAATAAVQAQWPNATVTPYSALDDQGILQGGRGLLVPEQNLCPYADSAGHATSGLIDSGIMNSNVVILPGIATKTPAPAEMAAASTDWRCFGRSYSTLTAQQAHVHRPDRDGGIVANTAIPTVVVAGPELRRLITGMADPAADAALAGGGAVVMDRSYLAPNGSISSGVLAGDAPEGEAVAEGPDGSARTAPTVPAGPNGGPGGMAPSKVTDIRSVPAVLGAWSSPPLGVILSPQAARQLGWTVSPGGLIVDPGQAATGTQTDQLALAVQAATGGYAQATLEPGVLTSAGESSRAPLSALLIVIALLAAGTIIVVTALGLADSRPDLATLAAIGARPRIRRLVTGWTAALVAFLGCLLGGAVGLVPAWGLLRLIQVIQGPSADPIVVPWAVLLPALVLIPVAAFAVGALLPRSRLPMVARVE